MSALHVKLLRELWQLRGQVLSIAALIATAVAAFVAMVGAERSLRGACAAHYAEARFADVFAELKRAPRAVEEQIRLVPGVAEVEVRQVADVRLEVRRFADPIVGHLVSVPRGGASKLDRAVLRRGRWPDPARTDEVLVSEGFADAHRLQPGESIVAVIDGHRATFQVVGLVLSPEFVFAVRAGELVPDERRYGVVWMNEDALGRALDLDGAFNSVALTLAPGASEPEVLSRLDALLAPYGGLGSYARVDQSSHRQLKAKLDQLAAQAWISPAIFLGVAAFLLNTVLARLIGTQRPIVATLRAFGFGRAVIVGHYLLFATVIVALGAAAGVAFGEWMGVWMCTLYRQYYRLPALDFHLAGDSVATAVGVSLVASLGGVLSAVLRAAALSPAEAMRPEPPRRFRPVLAERLLGRFLSASARMVLRQLGRRPWRAVLGVTGIAFSVAIVVMSMFTTDAIDTLVDVQFFRRAHEDATVAFRQPLAGRSVHEIERLPGVLRVEATRSTPVRLSSGLHARHTAIQGLSAGAQLHPLLDDQYREIVMPDEGLLLTRRLGEQLGVGPGDTLRLELLEGSRAVREVRVAGLVDELMGVSAYMDIDALGRLLGEPRTVTSAYLALDAGAADAAVRRLQQMPGVSSVAMRLSTVKIFRAELSGRMSVMTVVLAGFAALIAVGVVYNGARIALAERLHELGAMRVMGFTRREVSALLLGELAIQVVAAIPVGFYLGWLLAGAMSRSLATDAYRIPLILLPRTYAWAAIVVTGAAALSAIGVRRRIDAIDLGEVLRTRE